MSVINITRENFQQEVMESDRPVLLDFWAPWCGPCRNMNPIMDEIAAEHPEIKVCKVNVQDEGELANQFEVMAVPTFFAIRNGSVAGQVPGAQSKQTLLELVQQ